MLKLLQLNASVGRGSTGRIAEAIAILAQTRGWECYIAHGARYVGASKMHTFQVSSKTVECAHFIKSLLFDAHGLGSKKSTMEFVSWIKSIRPDLIQLHNIHGYWIDYEILFGFLKESGIPIVWTFHDCWPMTGHCVHFSSVNCNKWKTECDKCPQIDCYPHALYDHSKKNYSLKKQLFTSVKNMTIVPVSYWLESVVRQSFMRNYPVHVIQNGIDLRTFYPRKEMKDTIRAKYGFDDKFIVLSVATKWHRDNGYYDLMELRKILDDQFEIVLVGVSEKQKKQLPTGITGIERTESKDELALLYSAADIVVTAQVEATFGLVTAEAMACGTPVVVYDSTACPEIVTSKTGFVIPPKDINAMRDAIISYSQHNDKEAFERNCVNQAALFDENKKYMEYLSLYESKLQ